MSVLSRPYEQQIAYSMGISLTSPNRGGRLYPKLQKSDGGKQHHGPPKVERRLEGRIPLVSWGCDWSPRFVKVPSANPFTIWPVSPVTDRVLPSIASPFFACSEHGSTID
jgi:hypothetical protein